MLDAQASQKRRLVDLLTQTAAAGARLFQYRDKTSSPAVAYRQALQLRQAAADAGAIFLVNDRCDLALAVGADGVHLGQEDLPLAHARTILGPDKIIGISTHNAFQVQEATKGGADYIGFGPIFPTGTKPDHEAVVGIEGFRTIRPLTHLPVFAIGGITVDKVGELIEAGADGVAVISAVAEASDLVGAVQSFMARLA
ncbi:MAG: thiamine phosphate synthase [Nitrospirae bacterium]|nr:thiamine phosphate synthase [Nitrospirota bacterium]